MHIETQEAAPFSSGRYWERRYQRGGNSGAGSYGRLGAYKAAFINGFVAANRISSVADFGCGDGNLLSMLDVPDYVGIDVSETVLARCRSRFAHRSEMRFEPAGNGPAAPAELAMSVDVLFHLVEDSVFERYLLNLSLAAHRFVLIYSSNFEARTPDHHVRHRRFTDRMPGRWRLAAHVPNPYPFDPTRPQETSFADFFVFAAPEESCVLRLPAGAS